MPLTEECVNLVFVHHSTPNALELRRNESVTKLREGLPVPANPVSVLPLRTGVLFPGATLTFAVGRPRSVALVRELYPGDVLVTLTQRDPRTTDVAVDDLYTAGTFARVKAVT